MFKLIPGYDPVATRRDCTFDAKVANAVVGFFEDKLTHIEGHLAGKPLSLEPWQKAVVGCAFGWKRPNGTRRYREVFQYVPRKNGKSTMLGGLINLVAFCDNEPGAQIYSAAADREQAALVYRQAKGMILNREELEVGTKIYATYKSIEYPNAVVYKALSADADTKHGFNTHFVVVDELHAQPNRELVDVLVTSTGSRRQPMVWYITTADYDRKSICNEKYDYACKVRDGHTDDPYFLPVIYEASVDDDWTSIETWRKANPNLDVSVSSEYLARECQRAQDTPSYENTFKRLHLNVRTQQDVRWIPIDLWDKGSEPFEVDTLRGRDCFAGLDFGWRDDYAAFVLVFPVNGIHYVLPWFWLPDEGRRDKRLPPASDFIAHGFVQITPGTTTDIEAIYSTIRECRERYNVIEIAIDPANARKQAQDLMADGFNVIEFTQSKRNYNEPCRFLESLLKERQLRHNGNPVLRWMAGNAAVELDGLGQIMPKKAKSSEKIDGIAAMTMALGRSMLVSPEPVSIYETRRDFLTFGGDDTDD
jgi:phage terminase large subunit-like protein